MMAIKWPLIGVQSDTGQALPVAAAAMRRGASAVTSRNDDALRRTSASRLRCGGRDRVGRAVHARRVARLLGRLVEFGDDRLHGRKAMALVRRPLRAPLEHDGELIVGDRLVRAATERRL